MVAVIRASESYENLSTGFKDVFRELNELVADPFITINEEAFKLKFYICCDYKVHIYSCIKYIELSACSLFLFIASYIALYSYMYSYTWLAIKLNF